MATILKVMAVGDSVMWGQGLKRSDTFALLAAERMATDLRKRLAFQNLARSGAKLEARIDKTKAAVARLRSGRVVPTFSGDRYAFVDRFPELFRTDKQAEQFLDEKVNDQTPARALFEDIPATFPTVTAQIRSVSDRDGAETAVLIMNGGANDIDFEEVLNPDGPSKAELERAIRSVMFEKLKRALKRARIKFPNAVIIYAGYFSAFTGGTDEGRLEELFKYLKDVPGLKLVINDLLESPVGRWTPAGIAINAFVDTAEDKVRDAINRSQFAFERSVLFIKKAIAEVNALERGKPGIIFADPAFTSKNGLFASKPLVHEGYRPPNSKHKDKRVRDALLRARERRFPRIKLVPRLDDLSKRLKTLRGSAGAGIPPGAVERSFRKLQPRIRALRNALDGPRSLRELVNACANGPFNPSAVATAATALDKESASLKIAQIASFVHPNEAGARRYADAVYRAWRAHI